MSIRELKLVSLLFLLQFSLSCGFKSIIWTEDAATESSPAEESQIAEPKVDEQTNNSQAAPIKKPTPAPTPAKASSLVELVWEAPSEPVERYHIAYGTNPSNLDRKITVPISDITKVDDPTYGPLFKYILKNVPPKKTIYVSLTAENRSGRSTASQPFKVDP